MNRTASRTDKSIKNFTVGAIGYIVTLFLSFIARTIFIKCLSAEYLGINGLFSNILTVLSFAELGIGDALVFSMYKPAKEGNYEKLEQLLDFYRKAYRAIALVVGVVGFALSFCVDFLVAEKPAINENFRMIFLLFLLDNVCSYLQVYKQAVLTIEQDNYVASLLRMAVRVFATIAQSVVLVFTHNYYLYLIMQIAATISSNIVLAIYVNKHYSWAKKKSNSKLAIEERNAIFKDVKALAVSKIASVVSNGSDNLVIAKILGLTSVGIVSNYTLIINSIYSFLWSAISSVSSSFGNLNVDASIEKKRSVFNELYLFTLWVYAFVSISVMVLINPFISVWLGDEYLTNQAVAFALVLIVFISGINFPIFTFRTTCGYFDEAKSAYVWFAILNITLSVILGKHFGLFGVYIATSISRFCTSEIREGIIVYRKVLELPVRKYFIRYIGMLVLVFLNYEITNCIVSRIQLQGIGGFFVKAIVCAIICNMILLACFFRTVPFKNLTERGMQVIKKKKSK